MKYHIFELELFACGFKVDYYFALQRIAFKMLNISLNAFWLSLGLLRYARKAVG